MVLNNLLVQPLYIAHPKMSVYAKSFDVTKYMSFSIEDEKLLKAYNKVWNRISDIMQKRFNSKPVYNEKYSKSERKTYGEKIQILTIEGVPKTGSHCACLLVILIDCIVKMGRNYYPQAFFEKYKYSVKEKNINKFINDELEFSLHCIA